MIELQDVYTGGGAWITAGRFLYQLLAERKVSESISHKRHPSWEEHWEFVQSKPYLGWYLIVDGEDWLGTCYITKYREVGIWLMPSAKGRGAGRAAIRRLLEMYPGRVFTNTSLYNDGAKAFYEKMGFRHCANMLECENISAAEASAIRAQEMVDGWKGKPLAGCSDRTSETEQHTFAPEGDGRSGGYTSISVDAKSGALIYPC